VVPGDQAAANRRDEAEVKPLPSFRAPAARTHRTFPMNDRRKRRVLFALGQTYATPAALDLLRAAQVSPADLLAEHQAGNWGDLDSDDAAANELAVTSGARILSVRKLGADRIYVITEAENDDGLRASTTILLCSEY
jgi:hypothetical protein